MAEKEKNGTSPDAKDTTKVQTESEAKIETDAKGKTGTDNKAPPVGFIPDPAYQSHYRYSNPGEFPGRDLGGCGGCDCCPCNPCKCCCGGNLRKACFAIGIFEIIFSVWNIPYIIYSLIVYTADLESDTVIVYGGKWTNKAVLAIPIIIFFLVILATPISMLLGAIKRIKVACIIHTVLAFILGGVHVLLSGTFLLGAFFVASLKGMCGMDQGEYADTKPCLHKADVATATLVVVGIYTVAMSVLFLHFGVDSASLYCQFRAGINYEGEPLCGRGSGGNQIQPQPQYQWKFGSKPENKNQDAPPPPPPPYSETQKEGESSKDGAEKIPVTNPADNKT